MEAWKYKCNNKIHVGEEEKTCGNLVEFEVNITDIKPEIPENHTNKIELTPTMGVVMKYPNFKMLDKISSTSESEMLMETTLGCIDYIYDEDEIHYAKDVKKEELKFAIYNGREEIINQIKENNPDLNIFI